jgi:hypothetical protein
MSKPFAAFHFVTAIREENQLEKVVKGQAGLCEYN